MNRVLEDGTGLRETRVTVGDTDLNLLVRGSADQPVMLFLHGFPEYSAMWTEIMGPLSDAHFCVAPDQRGYNLSSRPTDIEQYKTSRIAGDAIGLIEMLSPDRPVTLVAHDWGASIAYAVAMWRPELIGDLIVINGLHPGTFQHALLTDPEQAQASQYIHYLRAKGTDAELAANDCAKMFKLYAGFSDVSWMADEIKAGYQTAWRQPGAITAMLNWYRMSPIIVPTPGSDQTAAENPFADTRKFRVKPRHLLIWGEKDPALRPSCHEGLEAYCDDLTKVLVPDADHWIVGAQPLRVVTEIRAFLDRSPSGETCPVSD